MPGPIRTPPQTKPIQPPRPPNAWILYRADKSKEIGRKAQSDVSKEISAMWKAESPHVRAEYERRADLRKAEHQAMYPEYRFQPVKKEEKERLKEHKKQEKERRKEAQRRGRANPQPAPSPTPAPALAPQPSRHYAPGSIFDPLAPYYLAEHRHGSLGPTPPLSAAPSPSESVTLDIPQSRVEDSSVSPVAHASSYPQTPSSVFGSPALPPSSYAAPFTNSQSPEPVVSEPPEWKDAQSTPSLTTSGNCQRCYQEFLSFDLPNPQMNDWTEQNLDIQAFLSATGDPSIFQLTGFDPESLLQHPTGQLEVSLGEITFPSFDDPIPNLSDFPHFSPQRTEFGSDMAGLFPAVMEPSTPAFHDFGGNYNADEFINFDENSSDSSMSREPPVEQRSPVTPRPYVPPAGAAFSSTRRVAGSWRPPSFSTPSPIEQSPTRSPWSVHA
ncbi:hypothetical protein B0H11DRAFT_1711498 [Mycena galericulata]|nr:hypothetical protein B0H11DRAFT_1711498 [Mycena galericulata]